MFKKLFTSTILYTIGGVLPMAASLVLVIPYTQQLMPADTGALAIYISLSLFIQILVNFGIDYFISIHYFEHKDNSEELNKFIGTMVVLLLAFGLLFTLILAVSGNLLFELAFKNKGISFFPFGLMSALTAIFNALFRTYTTLLIYRQNPTRFIWFNIINFIATIVFSLGALWMYPHTIIGPMWGRLLSGFIIFLLSFGFYVKDYGIVFDKTKLAGFWKFSIPVLLFTLLTWGLSYANTYILPLMKDVGIYNFAIQCTMLIEFTQNGLSNAINPKIFHLWKDKNLDHSTPEENKFHHLFTLVNIVLISVSIFSLPILITFVIKNQAFYPALTYIPYIAAGFVFRALYNMFLCPIYYFKKTTLLLPTLGISVILQVILGFIFIKYFGIWGAVISTLLVKPLQVILLGLATKRLFHFDYNKTKIIFLPLLYVGGIIAIYQLTGGANYLIPGSLQLLWAGVLILIAFRKEIDQVPLLFKK
jgi:O-antigen/teichoic acid export membrane protein